VTPITIDRFPDYFRALHGREPYAWQRTLAADACQGRWPQVIDLPTGSGKTACIDIALFALACQAARPAAERQAPRRIFFCVNRRIIVDEAWTRSMAIAEKLAAAERVGHGVLAEAAAALRAVSGEGSRADVPAVDVLELRGGIYRDNRWARSATQPTIICTTIDQLGSRLLFRGYGVSAGAAPIQAALVAFDSLVLLDEAHISRPFQQTLAAVGRALVAEPAAPDVAATWPRPMIVVPMTATPADVDADGTVLRLGDADRAALAARLGASKPTTMREVRQVDLEAVTAVKAALEKGPSAIGVIVNRVATARQIHDELRGSLASAEGAPVALELVIGSMRPLDRDEQTERLRVMVGPERPDVTEHSCVVVATQCLEVGADFDFDVLITESASLDALRQRFGRLNRRGRSIEAKGVLLAERSSCRPEERLKEDRPLDPIYGNAAARTWNWLSSIAEDDVVDFGIDAMASAVGGAGDLTRLLAPSARMDAPILLPAFVDFWCQTSPAPNPDPDISLFLHGDRPERADVLVCWRSDIKQDEAPEIDERAIEIVSLLPPTAAECMSVSIDRLRRWLLPSPTGNSDGAGDLLAPAAEAEERAPRRSDGPSIVPPGRRGVLWRGPEASVVLQDLRDLRPGDTLVLPTSAKRSDELGHLPGDARCADAVDGAPSAESSTPRVGAPDVSHLDRAEDAFELARARVRLRVCQQRRHAWPKGPAVDALFDALCGDERPARPILKSLIKDAADEIAPTDADDEANPTHATLARRLRAIRSGPRMVIDSYPGGCGAVLGSVGPSRDRSPLVLPALDDGDDGTQSGSATSPVSLEDHTMHVVEEVRHLLTVLPLDRVADELILAAKLHDLGKADERFQAWLYGVDRTEWSAFLGSGLPLRAKSGDLRASLADALAARRRAELPRGFRHEMLSAQLAARSPNLPPASESCDLVLHLIEAHHGHARPFAPIVMDEHPPAVEAQGLALTAEERRSLPSHRIDSGVADRFWRTTRRFGWWGAAYLEAMLRLADQRASARESHQTAPDATPAEHTT